ncbi:MAG: hypothetical protein ACK401_00805 [Archaeoglobaceae archaeon]
MDLRGQTFTLEGVAASLLLLIATYTIFQSTVVMSPAWSEFENVQLKQLGYDILRVLDAPGEGNETLRGMVKNSNCNSDERRCTPPSEFSNTLNAILSNISANARIEILCVDGNSNEIRVFVLNDFNKTPTPNAVRVSRFVVDTSGFNNNLCSNAAVVEVRLTLWR